MRLVPGAVALAAAVGAACLACGNNPYPETDAERKVLYTNFVEAPRTLDPAVAYTTSSHAITGNVYETLLEYHYLKRPYTLIPGLALDVPRPEPQPGGGVAYRFQLRPGLLYQDDESFALGEVGRTSREIVAADVAFELMRIADPAVNSPVVDPFSNLLGFAEFSQRLMALREQEPDFEEKPVREQYAAAGGIEGVVVAGPHGLTILLGEPYPQILYWFAMPFTTPVPWEAVAWYDGQEGRPRFADHPVGSGPYVLSRYDKQFRMVLERNPNWYGARPGAKGAPGAVYPSEGAPEDRAAGRLAAAGRRLPFIERVEFRREKEPIPTFNKFLQGYYDAAGIIKESFDKVIQNDRLSREMKARGIRLEKSVEPSVFYLGFNMEDSVVGEPGAQRARKLRQAMSLAIDAEEWTRLFMNGRGVPAQSPLPPGLFGYDASYRNPFRARDPERARALLVEAGYPGGIDPQTDQPLQLTLDIYATSSQQLLQDQYYVNSWREIGIDVRMDPTNYNQFQEKVRNGAYQIFIWGWVADYPDPENFFFLLTCDMARSKSGGPNTANFCNERFDSLFNRMRSMDDGEERLTLIREMTALLEQERPWIELFHREDYALYHGWLRNVKPFGMSFPTIKYRDMDPEARAERRLAWNRPVRWPAYALFFGAVALILPGIRTFFRERQ